MSAQDSIKTLFLSRSPNFLQVCFKKGDFFNIFIIGPALTQVLYVIIDIRWLHIKQNCQVKLFNTQLRKVY